MNRTNVALLRIPAFIIDSLIIFAILFGINRLFVSQNDNFAPLAIELIMFVVIPLSYFFYWVFGLNIGKKLFRLKVVDERTLNPPTIIQYFKRCLLFALLISFNLALLIPLFASKKKQSFHDMLAKTLVVRDEHSQ